MLADAVCGIDDRFGEPPAADIVECDLLHGFPLGRHHGSLGDARQR